MRRSLTAVIALAGALLAACGGGSSSTESTSAASSAATTTQAASAAFPVTIEHKFGSTTIESEPKRIVVAGLQEQDALLAVGVVPVATTEWFGEQPGAIWPWATDALGDAAVPEVLSFTDGFEFERIAALEPDVIVALYSGMTQEEYDTLSAIAPTVAQPGDVADWGIGWRELQQTVGKITGRSAQAEQVIADVDALFAQARTDHPEFDGATALVVTPYDGVWVYGPEDNRGRLLTELGFVLPEGLGDLTGNDFGTTISDEQMDLLDVDVLIWLHDEIDAGLAELKADPVYSKLSVHKDGREVHVASYEPFGASTSFVSSLSLPFLLEGLVPMLSQALNGEGPAISYE